jgi:hypothetical protein
VWIISCMLLLWQETTCQFAWPAQPIPQEITAFPLPSPPLDLLNLHHGERKKTSDGSLCNRRPWLPIHTENRQMPSTGNFREPLDLPRWCHIYSSSYSMVTLAVPTSPTSSSINFNGFRRLTLDFHHVFEPLRCLFFEPPHFSLSRIVCYLRVLCCRCIPLELCSN